MRLFRTQIRVGSALTVLALIAAGAPDGRLTAQGQASPYQMILTPDRALALLQASDRKLHYVPGEVMVKFRPWNGQAIQNVVVPYGINPDLGAARTVSPKDFVFWNGPVLDMVGHGTHVGSTIGEETNNALAEAGIAYNVKIMPVKVCFGSW